MKKTILYVALAILNVSLFAQAKWTVDNVHSTVRFSVSHLVVSEVEGTFKTYSGTITSAKPDFTDAVIEFSIDVKSINTENEMRDNHLKSADFFDAEKFPQATFKSTQLKLISGNKYALYGNLTIHGITKAVTFDVTFGGTTGDGYGNTKAGFKASTTINRFEYDLKWNKLTEAGGASVGQDVTITVKLELVKSK